MSTPPEISLVIPTYNERESIHPLLAGLKEALGSVAWEAVFVDDSSDGTELVLAECGRVDRRVTVLHRPVNEGGLAGAVVEGLRLARGTYVCVLDADLQHPPECIPVLLGEAGRTSADVVVASRYVPGGSAGGLDGPLRTFYSLGLKTLSRAIFPRRLARISDPLGGYFLVRRAVLEGVQMRPIGYKILLEILIRSDWRTAAEVPYRFQPRQHGASKANFRQGVHFLRHLARLAWDCSPILVGPRLLTANRELRSSAEA